MNITKLDDYLTMIKTLENLEGKPRLLLHSCCGPCNCFPMVFLLPYFNYDLFFNNSNIHPLSEYQRRLNELINYTNYINNDCHIELIIPPYDDTFQDFLSPLGQEKEGGKRCERCFYRRLEETFIYAQEHNYEYVASVMTISRQKNAKLINQICIELSKKYGVKYLISDFKKKGGIDQGIKIAKEHNMYQQTFCGCIYSKK